MNFLLPPSIFLLSPCPRVGGAAAESSAAGGKDREEEEDPSLANRTLACPLDEKVTENPPVSASSTFSKWPPAARQARGMVYIGGGKEECNKFFSRFRVLQ